VRLVSFASDQGSPSVGVWTDRGVVSLASLVASADPQLAMEEVIDGFAGLRPQIEELAGSAAALALEEVRLLAPLPRPGKMLCAVAGYDGAAPAPLLMTLKSAESVVGPGGVVTLPGVGAEWQFQPEAELGLALHGPARNVPAADWRSAVFGYTCVIDVMPEGDQQFGRDFWLAKSDTLGPLGPCIVTADEVADPSALRVRSYVDGAAAQEYTMESGQYSVPELVAFATTVMTLCSGDILACGTSRSGLRALRGGERVDVDIEPVGRLSVRVADRA